MTPVPGARDFHAVASSTVRPELDRLLALDELPVSRAQTWHAVASVLLATHDGQVLLARNRYGWGTVGGHVEDTDESLRAAVVREADEELGITIDAADLEPLSLVVDAREVVPGCAHWDFCFTRLLREPIPVTAASDVSEAAWFALDDLPEVNDHMRRHLDALRAALTR